MHCSFGSAEHAGFCCIEISQLGVDLLVAGKVSVHATNPEVFYVQDAA